MLTSPENKQFIKDTITLLENEFHYLQENDLDNFYKALNIYLGGPEAPEGYDLQDMWLITDFFISNGVNPLDYFIKRIPSNAFHNSELIEGKVVIPPTITEIQDRAFAGSAIQSIIIPDSVKKIYKKAFMWCYQLEYVEIQGDTEINLVECFGNKIFSRHVTFACKSESVYNALSDILTYNSDTKCKVIKI